MFFHTDTIAESDLEHLVSLYARFSITTGSGQTITTILQFLSSIRKLPNNRSDLCKTYLLSNEYSYKSLCWPNVTSQSLTSPTMKLISNFLLWGKLLYQLRIHAHYESTQPTVRLILITKIRSRQWTGEKHPTYRSITLTTCKRERSIARGSLIYWQGT